MGVGTAINPTLHLGDGGKGINSNGQPYEQVSKKAGTNVSGCPLESVQERLGSKALYAGFSCTSVTEQTQKCTEWIAYVLRLA